MVDRRWVYAGLLVAAGVGLVRALRGPRVETGKSRVLLVGDSLAVGLGPPLRALAKDQRVAFDVLAKEGTRIDQWAGSQKLTERVQVFKPTMILISLGTNDEYLMGDGGTRQAPYMDELLKKLSTAAPVVWIGPPQLPKKASNGVVAAIQQRVPTSHYFPSQLLAIPRGPDALHPTARGYAGWAGSLWQWLS